MMRTSLTILLSCLLAFTSLSASSQCGPKSDLPTFDAATIKPPDPNAGGRKAGFYGEPGGRVFFGGTVQMLVMLAFNLQQYQIKADRDWTSSQWFEINAVPPESSPSRQIRVPNVEPAPDQRRMLQALLRDRFGFQCHFDTKEGEVYILSRGNKPLQLKPAKDPAADPRAVVMIKEGGIADGEAVGTNTTIAYLAKRLGGYLRLPVLNETGITGAYDFDLQADDPGNDDVVSAVHRVVDRLGLKLKRGRGPIQTLVIDHVQQPSAN